MTLASQSDHFPNFLFLLQLLAEGSLTSATLPLWCGDRREPRRRSSRACLGPGRNLALPRAEGRPGHGLLQLRGCEITEVPAGLAVASSMLTYGATVSIDQTHSGTVALRAL